MSKVTDKYQPTSQIEVREDPDKPKNVGKLNVKEFKLESSVEVKKGQQNDLADIKPAVGKLGKTWQPTSQIEVQKGQQNDVADIKPRGKLNASEFIKPAEEAKPEGKKGPLSMEDLVKADQRDPRA